MGNSIRNKKLRITFESKPENGEVISLELDMSQIPDWRLELQDRQFGIWCYPRISRGNYRYQVYGDMIDGEPTAEEVFVSCTMFCTHLGQTKEVKVEVL